MEERLQTLEAEVALLKALLNAPRPGVVGKTHPDFLETCVGIFADDPDFEELDQNIQQAREKERQQAKQSDPS